MENLPTCFFLAKKCNKILGAPLAACKRRRRFVLHIVILLTNHRPDAAHTAYFYAAARSGQAGLEKYYKIFLNFKSPPKM